MGKIGRKKWLICIIALLMCGLAGTGKVRVQASGMNQEVSKMRIEQAHAIMPDMEAYYYLDGKADASVIQSVYAGKEVQVVSNESYDKKSGIDYYFLLDVSASISEKYFQSIQNALVKFQSKMNENDRMTLITFGDEVRIIFQDKSAKDDCSSQIMELTNKDMTTVLFEAIEQTASMVDTDEKAMKRSIALVISDGEDFTTNRTTGNEALVTLERTSLPVYSMVAEKNNRGEENTYINNFGEFSRSSGGLLVTFNDETAWKGLKKIRDGLYKAKLLKMRAANNEIYQTVQPLTVTVSDQASATVNMAAKRSAADTEIPTASAEEISTKGIKVTFSERVLHADVPGNYKIVKDGEDTLVNYTVVYSESNGYEAVLTFENEFYNGEYEISYTNICDDSKEANLVTSVNALTIEDGLKEDTGIVKFLKQYWMVLVAVFTILVVALIILIFFRKVKKNKGVVVVDGKVTFGGNVGVKQKVEIQKKQGHEIIFEMNDRKQGRKEIPMLVEESIFVGRSDICDLYFNDTMLSKQHFVIEEGEDGFYIQDLGTTNGTMINGVKIHQKRKLNQGDTINAGMIELKVRW